MKASELIKIIQELIDKNGDLEVGVSEPHDYWGSCQKPFRDHDIGVMEDSRLDGPKKYSTGKAIIISAS